MAWTRPSRARVVWDEGFTRACFNCEHIRVLSGDLDFLSAGQKRKCVKGFRLAAAADAIDFAKRCPGYEYCRELSNRMFTG